MENHKRAKIGLRAALMLLSAVLVCTAGHAQSRPTVKGSVYGGGRMADVDGSTLVTVVNCKPADDGVSCGQYGVQQVFGGNDIAGQVKSETPNANSHSGTEVVIGTDETTNEIRIGSVYGGGNGYYTYGTSNDVSASNAVISVVGGVNTVANATSVKNYNGEGSAVATLSAAAAVPASVRTFVTIGTNNATNTSPSAYEYIDSVFGGAKNAYLTGATVDGDGTSVIINGGTLYAVFGGNNVGGGQPANTRQLITVNGTKSNTNSVNMGTFNYAYDDGLSRCVGTGTHGIRYLFGGGNAVAAQKVTMNIYGGQIDTCFAGGNSGTVAATTVNVNIGSVAGMTNTPKYDFEHSPYYTTPVAYSPSTSIYDIRCLFGGNNVTPMAVLPTLNLVKGGIHNVYGGGNKGAMTGSEAYADNVNKEAGSAATNSNRSTYVYVNSSNILIDTLYGGGQSAGTSYDTYVEIAEGKVGTVFGGTNIQGTIPNTAKSNVYVQGGTVYEAVFGGSNGFYRCLNDAETHYQGGTRNYLYDKTGDAGDDNLYNELGGLTIPYIWNTDVLVVTGATVKGKVYAGGNNAPVGSKSTGGGVAKVHVTGGTIGTGTGTGSTASISDGLEGSVFGGGNMTSVYGYNDVLITGTSTNTKIYGDVYGGNDKNGQVTGQGRTGTSSVAAADGSSLNNPTITAGNTIALSASNAASYVKLTGTPTIAGSVYGGGNGNYNYYTRYADILVANDGGREDVVSCSTSLPDQTSSFVDVMLDEGAYAHRVYAGGNYATVSSSAMVWLNNTTKTGAAEVGAIFGGNNMVAMNAVPEVVLLKGQVGRVYGGGNQGDMTGSHSFGLLPLSTYIAMTSSEVEVTGNIYGGCNSADVTNHTYVYITKGTVNGKIFGGNDAAGEVEESHVVVEGEPGLVLGDIYGGGNGDYAVTVHPTIPNAYSVSTSEDYLGLGGMEPVSMTTLKGRPYVGTTHVTLTGTATINGNVYGGGVSGDCEDTYVTIGESGAGATANLTFGGMIFGGGQGYLANMGIQTCTDCKKYYGVAQLDGSGNVTYGNSTDPGSNITAMGNILGTVHLDIYRIKEMTGRSTIFGGGHAGNVKDVELTLHPTMTTPLGSIYLGCLASDVQGTTHGVFNGYMPASGSLIDTIYGGNDFTGMCNHTDLQVNSGAYTLLFGAGNGDYQYKEWLEDRLDPENGNSSPYKDAKDWARVQGTTINNASDWSTIFSDAVANPYPDGFVTAGQCADTVPYSMRVDIEINDGHFFDNIYGGGNMGLVGNRDLDPANVADADKGVVIMNVHGGHFSRHIYTGACGRPDMRGWYFLGEDASNKKRSNNDGSLASLRTVDYDALAGTGKLLGKQLIYGFKEFNMDGGTVDFSVYGGSEAVDDGYPFECRDYQEVAGVLQTTLRPSTVLNITGGIIDKSVYGGGYQGNIYGSVFVNIGLDAVNDSPVWTNKYPLSIGSDDSNTMASFKPTMSIGSVLTLGASVFNASDWGDAGATAYFYMRGVYGGETNMLVDGEGYNTSSAVSSKPSMDIHYSLYGAGTSTEGGDFNRLITVRHYGDYVCPEPSKSLFSIQRADKVILDHVYLTLRGEQDAYTSYATPSYGLCRIDTLIFRIDNIILLQAPAVYIGNLVSMKDDEVYEISNTSHLYTNEPIISNADPEIYVTAANSEYLANDFYDNLMPLDPSTACQTEDYCTNNVNICDKVPTSRGSVGKPGAFNVLMMMNGSYVKVSPFQDIAPVDHVDDPGEHWGHVYGYMYLQDQDNTQNYVYSHDNLTSGFTADGGFISPCSCDNVEDATYDKERVYTNVDNHTYRTWRVGKNQGSRRRAITLVANVIPDGVLNDSIAWYNLVDDDSNPATPMVQQSKTFTLEHYSGSTETATLGTHGNELAYATATLELPPSNTGNFYVINSVTIDADNGGQLSLVDQAYMGGTDFFGMVSGVNALTNEPKDITQIVNNPNYTFGLSFSNGSYFDNACWNTSGTPGLPMTVTGGGEERSLVDGEYQRYSCWPQTLISGSTYLTRNGGYISNAVDGVGVIPTMNFTLLYSTNLSTSISRDVKFTFHEFTQDGTYVGPVEVTVNINTVLSDFEQLECPVLAMYNEGVSNKYVRSVTIPASFQQRDIYLSNVEWYMNPTVVAYAEGVHANDFHIQSRETAVTDNNHFGFYVKPSEHSSENVSNILGWYAVKDSFDVYSLATEAYQRYTGTSNVPDQVTYNSGTVVRGDGVTYDNMTAAFGAGGEHNPENGLWIGTLDGRAAASLEVSMNFDGLQIYHTHFSAGDPGPLAYVNLTFKYVNTKATLSAGNYVAKTGYFNVLVALRTRESGDTIYLAEDYLLSRTPTGGSSPLTMHSYEYNRAPARLVATYGSYYANEAAAQAALLNPADAAERRRIETVLEELYAGELTQESLQADYIRNNPDYYLTSIVPAMKIYREGDVIDIMQTLNYSSVGATTINFGGDESYPLQIIRYSGSHFKFPTAACALYGPMFNVNGGQLAMHDVLLNGSGCTRQKSQLVGDYNSPVHGDRTQVNGVSYCDHYPRTRTFLFANAPMVNCTSGGTVNLSRNVRMTNNFNKSKNTGTAGDGYSELDESSDRLFMGGGAVAVTDNGKVLLGNGAHIYDNAVVDWGENGYLPLNYGGAIYIDGGQLTLGTSDKESTFDVSRNFYMRNVSPLATTTTNLVSGTPMSDTATLRNALFRGVIRAAGTIHQFSAFEIDTASHINNYSLSNVYLTRKPWTTPDPAVCVTADDGTISASDIESHAEVQGDAQSDVILFVCEMTDDSRVGVSKWFPGYEYTHSTSASEHLDCIAPRDTIVVARPTTTNETLTDRVFKSNVFFNDSSFYSANSKFTKIYPEVAYNKASLSPNYNDNVWVFFHGSLNAYSIYFQRCATFGKGALPKLSETCDDQRVLLKNYGDTIYFCQNPVATCMASTDTVFFRVGGGFFPYTYKWVDSTAKFNTPSEPVVDMRERLTFGSNSTVMSDPSLVSLAQRDTFMLRNLEIPLSNMYKDFVYMVTATDLTGHCSVQQPVMIRSVKSKHTTYTDVDRNPSASYDNNGFLNKTVSHEVEAPGVDSTGMNHEAPRYLRVFRSYEIDPMIYPAAAQGVVKYYDPLDDEEKEFTSESEFCPGDVVQLRPHPASSDWEFVGWDFDPSGNENPNYVTIEGVGNNTPTVYYSPRDYWWQVVTTQPAGYQVDYYGNVTISSKEGLAWLISVVNGYNGQSARTFRFNSITLNSGDYDMAAHKWTPVGTLVHPFEGDFDGGSNDIYNIIVNEEDVQRVGMFGYVKSDHADIRDFKLHESLLKGNTYVGGVVAEMDSNATLQHVKIGDNTTLFGEYCMSGLVAKMKNESLVDGNIVSGVKLIGNAIYASHGVGYADAPTELRNNSIGTDSVDINDVNDLDNLNYLYYGDQNVGSYIYYGGLLGYSNNNNNTGGGKTAERVTVNNNYVMVNVAGGQNVGGLIGRAKNADLNNNYAYGLAKATSNLGGLVGFWDENVTVSNCYYEDGMANESVGLNAYGDLPENSTTFRGHGQQVTLTQHVGGYSNLTRALNKWVDAQGDTAYYHWRSAEGTENFGYPVFGDPDIIVVHDTVAETACGGYEFNGQWLDQSGTYSVHVVDSTDYLDSTFTLMLTVNYGDSTQVVDTVVLGNAYEGYGFNFTADEVAEIYETLGRGHMETYHAVDFQVNEFGCDSVVMLSLIIVNNGVDVHEAVANLSEVKLYPNPTRSLVHVEGTAMQRIEVYDQMSRRLMVLEPDDKEGTTTVTFDLTDHATGSYFVRVETAYGAVVKKVIKK